MPSARFFAVSLLFAAAGMVTASPAVPRAEDVNLAVAARAIDVAEQALIFNYSCTQPTLSKDPKAWSTKQYLAAHLPNPITPTPVFWSGQYNGHSVRTEAEACAAKSTIKGATVGQLMCNLKGFVMPSDDAPASGYELWDEASRLFAAYTKPTAYVVAGDARVTSIWFKTEWPTLKANTNVKAVIGLNPATCAKTCYWHCPNAADCQGLAPCTVRTV